MSGNLLEGLLPSELGNLSALEHLLLAEMGLTGTLPREIGKLENLKTLDLKKNRISGSVPVEWSGMRQLRYFYLQSNLLEVCPFDAVAEGCKYLRVLDNNIAPSDAFISQHTK
ncbi:hypothetical protein HDU79_011639 [Rhizoclosmatium sp. JEL0117]|nr:hypothetical protein HDU79_011639 [Rhizoclosmatium sp. JEL0117]